MQLRLLVLAVLLCAVSGELSRNQKQILQDLINTYRAIEKQTAVRTVVRTNEALFPRPRPYDRDILI